MRRTTPARGPRIAAVSRWLVPVLVVVACILAAPALTAGTGVLKEFGFALGTVATDGTITALRDNTGRLYVYDHLTGVLKSFDIVVDREMAVYEGRVLLAASEESSGIDYNGDGTLDGMRYLAYDAVRDRFTDLGIGIVDRGPGFNFPRIDPQGSLVSITVSEEITLADLNGDGDAIDESVIHLYDFESGAVTNIGIALHRIFTWHSLGPDRLLMGAGEDEQGADLNGDGDLGDSVVHRYELSTGTLHNEGIHARGIRHNGDWFLTNWTDEFYQGEDLDGDGQMHGELIVARNVVTDVTWFAECGWFGGPASFTSRFVYFVTHEEFGNPDLNGDGDNFDVVGRILDLDDGTVTDLGLATGSGSAAAGSVVWFGIDEADQFGLDRDGDGDATGIALVSYDVETGVLVDYFVEFGDAILPWNSQYVLSIAESSLGADRNGDADTDDLVFHVVDLEGAGTMTNLGVTGFGSVSGDWLAAQGREIHDGIDRNGDGDIEDDVVVRLDLATGERTDFASAARVVAQAGRHLVLGVNEYQEGNQDRNGDGDVFDTIAFVSDGPCAPGTVGTASGDPVDVLFVNGSTGGASRRMRSDATDPFVVSLTPAPSPARGSRYYVAVFAGAPGPESTRALPKSIGEGCFQPITLLPGYRAPIHVANELVSPADPRLDLSTGFATGILGNDLPGDVFVIPGGTFAPGDLVTVQGLIGDAESPSPKRVSLTNAVVVGIR